MDTCKVIQVIETTLTRRGEGIPGDPIRVIKEYWSLDGRLLWSVDPVEYNADNCKNMQDNE